MQRKGWFPEDSIKQSNWISIQFSVFSIQLVFIVFGFHTAKESNIVLAENPRP